MPNVRSSQVVSPSLVARQQIQSAKNKLDAENLKIINENHQRIQAIQTENRQADMNLITADCDIRLLRIKHGELEHGQLKQHGPSKPHLKQNIKQHVNTLYQQEGKYFGERAQLYRTPVYNPYLVKQYIESVKTDPMISTNWTSASGTPSQANFQMPNDSYENRPKLFAHKVFSDYELLKRNPLEQILTDPSSSASVCVQENGLTLQQSTYGGSYNTKKFLQEHEPSPNKASCELLYRALERGELEDQNIVLKSSADHVALSNYKNGLTDHLDLHKAREIVDSNNKKAKELEKYQYPRMVGPIPPRPYETIYCTDEISEHSDGNSKRYYERVYDSLNTTPGGQYAPLKADLQAMSKYEEKAIKDLQTSLDHVKRLEQNVVRRANGNEITFTDRSSEMTTRRLNDPQIIQQIEMAHPQSTYMANHNQYSNEPSVSCPQNDFYKSVEYTENVDSLSNLPSNIIQLHDNWSKSLANKNYLQLYNSSCPDMRKNIVKGKKRIMGAPQYVYKFANHLKQ